MELALKEAGAALKPEGRIIITTYSAPQVKRIKGAFYIKYPFPMIRDALIRQGFHHIEHRELVSQFVIDLAAIIGIKRNLSKREIVSSALVNGSTSSVAGLKPFFILPAGKTLSQAGLAASSAVEKDSVNKLKEAFNNLPWDSRTLAYLENSSLEERQNLAAMLEEDNAFIKLTSNNKAIKAYGVKRK